MFALRTLPRVRTPFAEATAVRPVGRRGNRSRDDVESILIVANDPDYLGEKTNSKVTNAVATAYLALSIVAAVAALPLLIVTKVGA